MTPPPAARGHRGWGLTTVAIAAVVLVLAASGAFTDRTTPTVAAPRTYEVSYSERILALPGFNPLLGDLDTDNLNHSQIPVLSNSPEQPPGIYYVDNDSELVDLAWNGTLRVVGPIALLYQGFAGYSGMLPDEFTLEYGTDEALFFGTLNRTTTDVSLELVNLTTGTVRMVDDVAPTAYANQQALYIGHETVLVFSANAVPNRHGPVQFTNVGEGVNMTTGANWTLPTLPFFEANNLYWLAQKHQLLNIEAEASDEDQVEQWNETGSPQQPNFGLRATVIVADEGTVDWVDGIAYNASAQEIAYSSGTADEFTTYVLGYDPSGVLTNQGERTYESGPSRLNLQRYVYTSPFVIGGFESGTQYLFDPWTGENLTVNEPFTDLNPDVCDGACFLGQDPSSVDLLIDFHASVARNDPFWSVVVADQTTGRLTY